MRDMLGAAATVYGIMNRGPFFGRDFRQLHNSVVIPFGGAGAVCLSVGAAMTAAACGPFRLAFTPAVTEEATLKQDRSVPFSAGPGPCQSQRTKTSTVQSRVLEWGCEDHWGWSKKDKSHEVRLYGSRQQTAHFHPNWSNGTAGVRGTRLLNRGQYYWEVKVSQRVFGTSMMFGVCTRQARLHVDAFVNMLGEDSQGWGLSHKGLLWHQGQWRHYTKPFRENESTTVGMLFDGRQGTLTYYKDGESLGVAFSGLTDVMSELYPMVCSTAAKTEMTLIVMRREFHSLQDRCRAVILRSLRHPTDVKRLRLPSILKGYLHNEASQDLQSTSTDKRDKLRKKATRHKTGALKESMDSLRGSCLFV